MYMNIHKRLLRKKKAFSVKTSSLKDKPATIQRHYAQEYALKFSFKCVVHTAPCHKLFFIKLTFPLFHTFETTSSSSMLMRSL